MPLVFVNSPFSTFSSSLLSPQSSSSRIQIIIRTCNTSSMAFTLCFCLIILVSSLSLVPSQTQYVLPDHYFINCGSNSDVNINHTNFIGDVNSSAFHVSGGRVVEINSKPASDTSPSIYQTARVFTKKSCYQLQADENNTFVMLRFHFFAFSSNQLNFSNSQFSVSVSGFSLLTDFSVGLGDRIVVKEFIIPIPSQREFIIVFTPSRASKFAFVNAIEAFTTPPDLFTSDFKFDQISPAGKYSDFDRLATDYAFNPIYRINVGGNLIEVESDTLRRNWVPDDPYLVYTESAKNSTFYDGVINYHDYGAAPYHAPPDVYKTAKQLNNNSFNITWKFVLNKSSSYLVRAHFCDIVSNYLLNPTDAFTLFIYSHYNYTIQPGERMKQIGAPFFVDFVVDHNMSGFVNISIGAIRDNNQTAFLNGLEIMELINKSGELSHDNNTITHIVLGCLMAFVLILLLVAFVVMFKYRKVKQMPWAKPRSPVMLSYDGNSYTGLNNDSTNKHSSRLPNMSLNLRIPFKDIMKATNGFNEDLMIGKGGFGKVYKGTLANGRKVAVKRGQKGHGQGRPEFVTEIMLLSKIRHRHLVALIGYCDENSEMILVYEFMEKGTLQDHLYNTNEHHPKLSWKQRLEICISAARGLHYLHTGPDEAIIHRDVKSTNILLNELYVAKVADFGISRLDNLEESDVTDIKGSFGYMDPEYIEGMKPTKKSDVYSFGVVLLEVLCARPAVDHKLPRKEANLAEWAIKQIKDGNVETIIDPFLVDTINMKSLRKFLETVEKCLKGTGDERPNMNDVQFDLIYALDLQETVVDRELEEDSMMDTSMNLPMSIIHRLPSHISDDFEVNGSSGSSYPSGSQLVFSQLEINEAR